MWLAKNGPSSTIPAGLVATGAGGAAQDASEQLAGTGQAETDHAPLAASSRMLRIGELTI